MVNALICIVIVSLTIPSPLHVKSGLGQQDPPKVRTRIVQPINVTVNGQAVAFEGAQPQMAKGRVMVPLRGAFEKIGAKIEWHPAKNLVRAIRGDTKIECWIGKRFAEVDGEQTPLDVPAMIVSGRTLVPLRFFSEALGARVSWSAATSTVGLDIE